MSTDGKVRVLVKSHRVPTGTVDISEPILSPTGVFLGKSTTRRVVYGYIFDEEHSRAIEEGRRLSCDLGLRLEVIDTSRVNFLSRWFSSLGRASKGPSVVVAPGSSAGTFSDLLVKQTT